ncbi:BDNF/NT-3 growth factors receptor-like protein [Leptotrombidium deliense]|uniref:BDNF/NT-3 growth factors receptor-like protein n=1 Tax=Leptotrombidium deliense TaxID=299467 RepID=A0A443SBX4_9ACAR|nr:BDNF/NT-3 growth factors receptor-like protein [Leptotrombidium deliense]
MKFIRTRAQKVVKLILQGILLIPPEDCPQCIYTLMAGCWKTEIKDRIKFATIFKELLENCSKERQEVISSSQSESISNDEEVLDTDNYLVPKICYPNATLTQLV